MELKNLRKAARMTQKQCAKELGVPLRTYINYENDVSKSNTIKYRYMVEKLTSLTAIDEEHGILTIDTIKEICGEVFSNYPVEYCYLFGSYAKQKANEKSDVDLLVSTPLSGLMFYEMAEKLRTALKKKIDLLNQEQLKDNYDLLGEILKDGIKIYG